MATDHTFDNPTISTDVTTSVQFLKMTKKMLQTD